MWLLSCASAAYAAPARNSSASTTSGYAVQVGAFSDAANAERRLATLKSFVEQARIFSGLAGIETRFFVIAGIFGDMAAAKRQAQALSGFGIETYIRPLSPAEARVVGIPNQYRRPDSSSASNDEESRQKAVEFLQRLICQPPLCRPDQADMQYSGPEE